MLLFCSENYVKNVEKMVYGLELVSYGRCYTFVTSHGQKNKNIRISSLLGPSMNEVPVTDLWGGWVRPLGAIRPHIHPGQTGSRKVRNGAGWCLSWVRNSQHLNSSAWTSHISAPRGTWQQGKQGTGTPTPRCLCSNVSNAIPSFCTTITEVMHTFGAWKPLAFEKPCSPSS